MPDALKKQMEGLLREEGWRPAHVVLYVLSLFYSAAMRMRALFYALGVFKTTRLSCAVVSVGNITVGGSGKTPIAMHVAALFMKKGKKPVILSRGYGRTSKGVAVVSDGNKVLLGPDKAGDEPYLMATRLSGVPVVVGEDRVKAGRFAIETFKPDVIILDDGFQHLRLYRDVNIALIDGQTGFGNGHTLPRGIMRESSSALNRADIIMVKGGTLESKAGVILRGLDKPLFNFNLAAQKAIDLAGGKETGISSLHGKKAVAIAGLANPQSFFKTLDETGAVTAKKLAYPDHHAYSPADLNAIKDASKGCDFIITTEKDGVKLKPLLKDDALKLYALVVDVTLSNGADFEKNIFSRLRAAK